MKNFKDKIAVITGAGSGIGQALAIELGKRGAKLILSDKDEDTLANTKVLVETIGASCKIYTVDVSDEKQIDGFVKDVLKENKHIDLLFNNAGFALGKISMKKVKMEDFHKIMDVNVWGLFLITIVMDEGHVLTDGLTMEILDDEELLSAHGLENSNLRFEICNILKQSP